MHQEYRGRGLTILAVNMEEGRDTVAAWVKEKKLTMDVLLDPFGDASAAWSAAYTPMVFVVGRDGKLIGRAIGRRAWTAPEGRALLDALLAQ